mmetsp:Transcript_618/g.1806  ORF Transcript_618/g.1806 Transcript_618/m.1806 type:complete len:517 (-) Transcript_618:387-1937(-)
MRKRPNSSMSSTPQSVMKYNNERRVVVSLNTSDNSLSIVDHPKDVLQRLFQRRPARSLELSAVRSLSLTGSELSLGVSHNQEVRLECASPAEGEIWYSRLRGRCQTSAPSIVDMAGASPITGVRSQKEEDDKDECAHSTKSKSSSQESLYDDPPSDDEEMTPVPVQRPAINSQLLSRHTDGTPARLRVRPIEAIGFTQAEDIHATLTSRNAGRTKSLDLFQAELDCTRLSSCLFIGGRPTASDRSALAKRQITHVLNMAAECDNFFEDAASREGTSSIDSLGDGVNRGRHDSGDGIVDFSSDDDTPGALSGSTCAGQHRPFVSPIAYMRCPCTDSCDDDITPYLDRLTTFVRDAWTRGGKVLIHCNSGISRSSAAVLACVLRWGVEDRPALSLFEAFKWLKDRRPIASPHPAYMLQLCDYEVRLRGGHASINHSTYNNNRYEKPDKLHASLADPCSSARLLGERACPPDMSPVYCHHTRNFSPRFPSDGNAPTEKRRHSVTFVDATIVDAKHRVRA